MRRVAMSIVFAAACGSNGSDPPDGPTNPMAERYEPWSTGAVWSYKLTAPSGSPSAMNKLTTVMAPRDVGDVHAGTTAFLVHIEQLFGSKDVYEAFVGDLDVRYQSTFYDANGSLTGVDVDLPYRLKLDESAAHTITGAQWSETFTEMSDGQTKQKTEQWLVVNAAEPVTVIAGSYTALHVRRTSSGGTIQDYWYVKGVGKVKEVGGAQIEELISFTPGS